jgi:hypothetical protein
MDCFLNPAVDGIGIYNPGYRWLAGKSCRETDDTLRKAEGWLSW